jgi:hypothetical protein
VAEWPSTDTDGAHLADTAALPLWTVSGAALADPPLHPTPPRQLRRPGGAYRRRGSVWGGKGRYRLGQEDDLVRPGWQWRTVANPKRDRTPQTEDEYRAELEESASLALARWRVVAYPGAGEAAVSRLPQDWYDRAVAMPHGVYRGGQRHVPGLEPERRRPVRTGCRVEDVGRVDESTGEVVECDRCCRRREAANAERSARRARSEIRRFVVANGLGYLWTCTYDDAHLPADLAGAFADVQRFTRHFSEVLYPIYGRFPWCLVVERGEESGRLHVHLGVDRYIDYEDLNRCWARDGQPLGQTESPDGVATNGRRYRLEDCAGYLSEYAKKAIAEMRAELPPGAHCYTRARGFSVERVATYAVDLDDAKALITGLCGDDQVVRWTSSERWTGYHGPPVHWCSWRVRARSIRWRDRRGPPRKKVA